MALTSSSAAARPHIIVLPFPLPGHIRPLLQLCKILVSSGFSISFVVTPSYHTTVVEILSSIEQQPQQDDDDSGLGIRLVSIPDTWPGNGVPSSWEDWREFLLAKEKLRWAFEPLVEQLISEGLPLVCILSDVYLAWTQDVADKFGVPRLAFSVTVAAECQVYAHVPRLISAGVLPFKAPANRCSPDDVDNLIPGACGKEPIFHRVRSPHSADDRIHVPGLPLLDRRDFPSLLQIEDSSDVLFQYFIDQTKRISEAYMVIFNSFLDLEASVFASMRAECNAIPLGPLFLLMEKVIPRRKHNLLSEEDSCLRWLDKQPTNSVLYVASGSMSAPSPAQVTAMAKGLEASQQKFLWALLSGQCGPFPQGFLDRTKGRGLVIDWAPQRLVLEHPAVGGFLTVCGWNSVMESLSLGVPVIGLPLWTDHYLICKLIVDEWVFGTRLEHDGDGYVGSEDVERVARELMEGERGEELRRRAREWSGAAQRAVESGGSSFESLKVVVEKLKQLKSVVSIRA